jgi:hypothetical protein
MRGSCWTHVYIKNVIETCKKITGGKSVEKVKNKMILDFQAIHQCSSPEQFKAVAKLWINEYCNHAVPSVQV